MDVGHPAAPWGLAPSDVDLDGKQHQQRHSDDSDEAALLRDRQELETWTREAARENLTSWGAATPGSRSEKGEKDHQQIENWGGQGSQVRNHHPARSEPDGGGGADSSPTTDSRECATAGALDNAASRSAARAKARSSGAATTASAGGEAGGTGTSTQSGGEYAGRRGTGAGGAGYSSGNSSSMSSGAPCGACKFLRRKCVRGCIFAPYFGAEQGAAKFAAVHKVFGASNVAKLLLHIPTPRRCDAVLTISYEAQARLSDPVYGCVATIFALQQQVPASLLLLLLIFACRPSPPLASPPSNSSQPSRLRNLSTLD